MNVEKYESVREQEQRREVEAILRESRLIMQREHLLPELDEETRLRIKYGELNPYI